MMKRSVHLFITLWPAVRHLPRETRRRLREKPALDGEGSIAADDLWRDGDSGWPAAWKSLW